MRLGKIISLLLLAATVSASAIEAPTGLYRDTGATILLDNGAYYLGVTLRWTNNDVAPYVVVQASGDGGNTWTNDTSGVHNYPTSSHVAKVPQNYHLFYRVYQTDGLTNSLPSNSLEIWGSERPASFALTVVSTNEVRLQWRNQTSTNEDGFILQRSTNSAFSSLVDTTSVRAGTNSEIMYATNTGYLLNVAYYWRVEATNSLGYWTEWSPTISATPAAPPGAPALFQARNGSTGVDVTWTAGTGVADLWRTEVSVVDTNSFAVVHSSADPANTWVDTGETPGSVCYYRIQGSNACGVVYSPIQTVVVSTTVAGNIWYINPAAVGNNSGTNWTDAWPNFGSVAWNNLNPGALIWVAPGNYPETLYTANSGASNAPITFKLATTNAPASRGTATLQSIVNFSKSYITFDGALDDGFVLVGKPLTAITNNTGFCLVGATNIARAVYTYSTGIRFLWCDVSGDYLNSSEFGEGSVAAFFFASGVGTNSEVGYCWVHDMTADPRSGADGISWGPDSASGFAGLSVHHTIIERVRDNFIGGGGCIDIHDCILRDWTGGTPSAGHPDGIQNGAGYWRFYNNEIRDTPGSCIYPELVLTNTVGVFIYNNRMYGTGTLTNEAGLIYPGSGVQWSTEPQSQVGTMWISNVVIANNTFYGFDGGYLSVTRRVTQSTNVVLQNWIIANNLCFTHSSGSQFGAGYASDESPAVIGTNFTGVDVILDFNDVCGSNNIIGWQGTDYDPATGYLHNITNAPQFASLASWDFHLTNPTNLVGTNLASLSLPGLDRNADGTLRSITGWPVGAYGQSQSDGLVMWLSFNGWGGTTNVPDASPGGCDLTLPYSALNTPSTNYPAATNGPNGLGAALLTTYRYGIVTNLTPISNLTNGTVALWGYYSAGSSGDSVFLDGGNYGDTNNWWMGRDDSFFNTRFWIHDAYGNKTNGVSFPDSGTATPWMHYAVTWAGNVFVGYTNGVAFVTNTVANAPYRTITQPNGWMAIGCMTHGGTSDFTDNESANPDSGFHSYPNNGWLQGGLADLRIYARTLTAAEVSTVYTGIAAAAPPPEAPTNSVTGGALPPFWGL